jgi:hypothetical protein
MNLSVGSGYPVAAVGINLSSILAKLLSSLPSLTPLVFLPNAIDEIFCALMYLFDGAFRQLDSKYMDAPEVFRLVTEAAPRLFLRCTTIEHLRFKYFTIHEPLFVHSSELCEEGATIANQVSASDCSLSRTKPT